MHFYHHTWDLTTAPLSSSPPAFFPIHFSTDFTNNSKMGGGNAQKSAIKRARNQEKAAAAAGGKSQLEVNKSAQSIICQSCRQTFQKTSNLKDLQMHHESKHSKLPFTQCFPDAPVA